MSAPGREVARNAPDLPRDPLAPRRRAPTKVPPLGQLMSTRQAVEYAHRSRSQLYRMAADGLITRYRIGSRALWDRNELDALVRRAGDGVA